MTLPTAPRGTDWKALHTDDGWSVVDSNGDEVCHVPGVDAYTQGQAEFLARVVNAHGPLVEALETARHALTTLHGLTATDEPLLPSLDRWMIDESKALAVIDAALSLARWDRPRGKAEVES